jgi:hypothetical protein
MSPRTAVRQAWGLWGLAAVAIAAALAVNAVQLARGEPGVLAVLSLVFVTVGAFLAGRPRRRCGCDGGSRAVDIRRR